MSTKAIDYDLCLQITNNAEVTDEILGMMLNDLPDMKQSINTAFASKDAKALASNAHKLHGACCYCGTTQLKELISTLENQARSTPPILDSLQLSKVMDEIDRVLQSLIARDYK